MDGFVEEAAGEAEDRPRHGGGKQHGLVLVGECPHEFFDVGKESQVEHFVGFVENEYGHVIQCEVAALVQVDESPGGADDDVRTLFQGVDLFFVGASAVDGEDSDG